MIPLDGQPTLSYFVDIVRRDHPDWGDLAVRWQARKMLERHPFIEKAYRAYLDMGRDVRERLEHGQGFPFIDEMAPLMPMERGFVMDLVRAAVEAKATVPAVTLVDVKRAQGHEAQEQRDDDLAAEWREKSNRPDSRVKHVVEGKIH